MIILYRLTSFVLAAIIAAGFLTIIYFPERIWMTLIVMFVLSLLLLARLLKWDWRRFSFWVFLVTPLFLLFSAIFILLFLEEDSIKLLLGFLVTIAIWLYAENLFTFYHLPSAYQAYALEYLSLAIYIATFFFFTSGAYASQLFLQMPLWVPAIAVFWASLFATSGVFWVSKVSSKSSVAFSVTGAILMTELYIVFAMLPTSFFTNAAALCVFLYLFLGLCRAHLLDKLSKPVLWRYLMAGLGFLIVIFATAKWM